MLYVPLMYIILRTSTANNIFIAADRRPYQITHMYEIIAYMREVYLFFLPFSREFHNKS